MRTEGICLQAIHLGELRRNDYGKDFSKPLTVSILRRMPVHFNIPKHCLQQIKEARVYNGDTDDYYETDSYCELNRAPTLTEVV